MKVSISVGSAYYNGENWPAIVEYVKAADRLGADAVWSAEAWGMDAVVALGYLAAVTDNIRLGSGIMQISARTPATTVLTSLSLALVSSDRFLLGLGVSGPQVVEGLHGDAFAKPLSRLREYIEIVKMGLAGKHIEYAGDRYVLPRPGGEGKALRTTLPPKPNLPLYLATLGPKALELTGEMADGWLGTSFIPEKAEVFLGPLRAGAERAGRSLTDLDLQINSTVRVSDDVDGLIEEMRPRVAFTLGGMGSSDTNFYNAAFSRAGFADECAQVQRLWVEGDKAAAAAAVPEDLILSTYMLGTEQMVIDRIRAYAAVGVTSLRLVPHGDTPQEQADHLAMVLDLVGRAEAS